MNTPRLAATLLLVLTVVIAAVAGPARPKRTASPTVTYAKDIAPILYRNCAGCHHAGEVAPFSLTSYQDAAPRAAFLAAVTQSRYMPPWKADRSVAFADQRGLTDAQIALIRRWSAEGAPLGDPKAAPPTPRFTSDWTLGPPDAAFSMPSSYHLSADGSDVYRCFVLPTHYAQDRWVTAIQVRPGDARVVHHVIAYIDTSGRAARLAAQTQDGDPGYTSFWRGGASHRRGMLGGWAPGNGPHPLPAGVGLLLPKNADIVPPGPLPQGRQAGDGPHQDRPVLRPRAGGQAPAHLAARRPAGDTGGRRALHHPGPTDCAPRTPTLLEILPHMHLLGRTISVTATLPDGTTRPLVNIPDWDFNWQATYVYRHPVALPKGTVLRLTAAYDNSVDNPRNPNVPPRPITWGEQTTDEMCLAFLFYTVDSEHLARGPRSPQ